jgi:hypothetical protein
MATTMPVADATNPEDAAITAATPTASISAQVYERLRRERLGRAVQLELEHNQLFRAAYELAHWLEDSPVDLGADEPFLE